MGEVKKEETARVMSELGRRSWAKRIEKFGEEGAKKLMKKYSNMRKKKT